MPLLDDYLIVSEFPEIPVERLVMAFRGWPDAGDAATTTINYLLSSTGAVKFAEIDPEEFYNFAQERPRSTRSKDGKRHLQWPANEFFYWAGEGAISPLVFYLVTEPHLRWRTFSSLVAELAKRCGVRSVVHIGALLDAVPHTRDIRLSGSSSNRQIQGVFDKRQIRTSNYQGPSGITLPISESLVNKGISFTSLWGHVSHYLHATPNFRVSLGLAQNLSEMLNLPVDLQRLGSMADAYDQEVDQVITDDQKLGNYIATLEERYDESAGGGEMPDPAELVRELEHFLRAERGHEGTDESSRTSSG